MRHQEDGERVWLTPDEAIGCLPDTPRVHTFMNGSGMLIGADWDREQAEAQFRESGEVEVAGGSARAMGHALFPVGAYGRLFVAHDEDKLVAMVGAP
ncbi:MAG: hypothetical protein GY788_21020 [bacterium]|nr:hypothetical protein [bacterium]